MLTNICRHLAALTLLLGSAVLGTAGCSNLPTDAPPPTTNPPTNPPPEPVNPPAPTGHVVIGTQLHGLDGPVTVLLEIDLDASTRRQILSTDSLAIDVTAGEHSIGISGLSDNCSADPGTSQRVKVEKDAAVPVRFDINCVALTGVVRATLTTTGPVTDLSGYTAWLSNGSTMFHVGANGTFYLFPIGGGPNMLTLADIEPNCRLNSDASKSFSITVGGLKRDTVDVAWDLVCFRIDMIAFRRATADSRDPTQVYTANVDGSNQTLIWSGFAPAWSPDGETLAFGVIDCFYYTTCVRGGLTAWGLSGISQWLTDNGADEDPAWRPTDGAVVAFTRNDALHLVDATRRLGAVTKVPTPAGMRRITQPSWSPDGLKIAVACEMDDGRREICVVDPNTATFVRLTDNDSEDTDPAWSPDGSRIAFSLKDAAGTHVAVMSSTGGEATSLIPGKNPAWSPDGTMLLFEANPPQKGILRIALSSRAVLQITGGDDHDPAWHL